ncbi:MAG: hypothetical protein Q4G27_11210 [Flavobacteriaceae bacterium]|nr:hypothetical protein [Flavobacteriaceae bacterium]
MEILRLPAARKMRDAGYGGTEYTASHILQGWRAQIVMKSPLSCPNKFYYFLYHWWTDWYDN